MGDSAIISVKDRNLLISMKPILAHYGIVKLTETSDPEQLLRIAHTSKHSAIIIDPCNDGTNGIRVAKIIAREKLGPVIFIVSNMKYLEAIEEIVEKESYAATYIKTPFHSESFRVALRTTIIAYKKIFELENKLIEVNETLAEKRKVAKAKRLLIKNKNVSEEAAHKFIQKTSMNSGKSMRFVAEKIIKQFS